MNALESLTKALEWINDFFLNPWIFIPGVILFSIALLCGFRRLSHLLFDYSKDLIIWMDPISRFLLLFSKEPEKASKKDKSGSKRIEDMITYPEGYGEVDSYEEHLMYTRHHPRTKK